MPSSSSTPPLSHEATEDLLRDARRDTARAEAGSFDRQGENILRAAEKIEDERYDQD